MRKLLSTISCAIAMTLMAQIPYAETADKAKRAFHAREWATASALCNFMIHQRPEDPAPYGPAIVAADAMGDSTRTMELLRQAMQYSISLDTILTLVRQNAFAVAHPRMYQQLLLSARQTYPWMRRPLDAKLLQWAQFRNDGPAIIRYARTMHQGLPQAPTYLNALAQGNILMGDTTQAIQAWEQCLRQNPGNLDALLNLGNYHLLQGRRDLAMPYLKQARDIRPTPHLDAIIGK